MASNTRRKSLCLQSFHYSCYKVKISTFRLQTNSPALSKQTKLTPVFKLVPTFLMKFKMEAVNTHNKNQRPKHAKQTMPSCRYHVVGNDFERLVHEPNYTGLQKYSFLHH